MRTKFSQETEGSGAPDTDSAQHAAASAKAVKFPKRIKHRGRILAGRGGLVARSQPAVYPCASVSSVVKILPTAWFRLRHDSPHFGIHARVALGVAFVNVLEEGGTLLFIPRIFSNRRNAAFTPTNW